MRCLLANCSHGAILLMKSWKQEMRVIDHCLLFCLTWRLLLIANAYYINNQNLFYNEIGYGLDGVMKVLRLEAIANLLIASVFKFMKLLSTSVLDKGLPLAVAPVTRVIITAIDSPY